MERKAAPLRSGSRRNNPVRRCARWCRSQYFSRHGIIDVATDQVRCSWSDLGHDIAMRLHAWFDVLISRAAARPTFANEIADLRREFANPIRFEGIAVVGESIVYRRSRIGRMGGAIFKSVSRARGPHDPGDERRAPRMSLLKRRIA